MSVIKTSIKDLSNNETCKILSEELSTCYGVSLDLRSFAYVPPAQHDLQDLKIIFSDVLISSTISCPAIDGLLNKVSFQESKKFIDLCLSCGGGAKEGPITALDLRMEMPAIAEKRIGVYWSEVSKYIDLPPSIVFEHKPSAGTYFDRGTFWQFCFMYFNDKTQQGLVLSGECFD